MMTTLFIGPRNYSSWSLRPWLALKWAGLPFEERLVDLDAAGYGERKIAAVAAVSPGGTVPALHHGDLRLWDSLAICEWAAEQKPDVLWPRGERPGACKSSRLRNALELCWRAPRSVDEYSTPLRSEGLPAETLRDIARIEEIWSGLRARYRGAGAHLFGKRSVADAFFTPVATRFGPME